MTSWEQVIGQDRAKSILQQAISHERIAHAYLFHGPYGTGKRAAALAFARALQCKVAPGTGCMECSDCSRINRMIHPDVRVFMPLPGEVDTEVLVSRLGRLGQNPYETVDFIRDPTAKASTKQVIYSVNFVREVLHPIVSLVAFEGGYKVIVLTDASAMRVEFANAFLKLLEEPSARTVFILTTEHPSQLVATILSRCQTVRFDPLSPDQIELALIEREGLSQNDAATYSRLADGSYSMARDFQNDDVAARYRAKLLPLLRWIYKNDIDQIMTFVKGVPSDREEIKVFLGLLLTLIRDLILMREVGPNAPIVNGGDRQALVHFVESQSSARLDQMVSLVEEAWYLISRNVHQGLVLTSLMAGIGSSMRGEPALPLDTPLAEQLVSDFE